MKTLLENLVTMVVVCVLLSSASAAPRKSGPPKMKRGTLPAQKAHRLETAKSRHLPGAARKESKGPVRHFGTHFSDRQDDEPSARYHEMEHSSCLAHMAGVRRKAERHQIMEDKHDMWQLGMRLPDRAPGDIRGRLIEWVKHVSRGKTERPLPEARGPARAPCDYGRSTYHNDSPQPLSSMGSGPFGPFDNGVGAPEYVFIPGVGYRPVKSGGGNPHSSSSSGSSHGEKPSETNDDVQELNEDPQDPDTGPSSSSNKD